MSKTYLVTGASGFLGRLVVEALLERGAERVIATTRDPAALADLAARRVEVRAADFSDPAGLAAAFAEATHLLMISTHGVGSRSATHGAAIDAANAAGVEHLFYTSHPFPETSTSPVAPEHAVTEKMIRDSGMAYTILRNCLYCENLMRLLPRALETGEIYGAAGAGRVSWLPRKDCAEAAAAAMIDAVAHANRTYDVTGRRPYSYAELAALLSDVSGKTVVYKDLSPDAYRAHLMAQGLPEAAADVFLRLQLSLVSDEMGQVTDVVERLTGHPPGALEDFLRTGFRSAHEPATLDFLKGSAHG
jgi:NAD(P)H dehydrogenase (quinone)